MYPSSWDLWPSKTNLNLKDGDVFDLYDQLRETGLLNDIIYDNSDEYNMIFNILNEEVQEELRLNKHKLQLIAQETNNLNQALKIDEIFDYMKENSVEAQLKKFLAMALEKIPTDSKIQSEDSFNVSPPK